MLSQNAVMMSRASNYGRFNHAPSFFFIAEHFMFALMNVYNLMLNEIASLGLDAAYNRLAWSIALFFNYLYHAINFFLYNVSSEEFRMEFKRTVMCHKDPVERTMDTVGAFSTDLDSNRI